MNKYLKRTLVVASVMIIIFSIIMLWPLPLRKVLRQETDTAMTVSLSDNDTIIYTGNSGLVIDTASGRVFVDRGTAEHTYRMNYLGQNDSAKLTAQIKKVLKI